MSQLAWDATRKEVESVMNDVNSSSQSSRESLLLSANDRLKQWFDNYEAKVVVTENESAANIIRARRIALSRSSAASQTGVQTYRLHPSNKMVLEALRLKADLLMLIGSAHYNEVSRNNFSTIEIYFYFFLSI
jgi:hypothetical protein